MNISVLDGTPQEDVLPGSCSSGHWNNSDCSNCRHTAQEVADHQSGLIIFMLILYGISSWCDRSSFIPFHCLYSRRWTKLILILSLYLAYKPGKPKFLPIWHRYKCWLALRVAVIDCVPVRFLIWLIPTIFSSLICIRSPKINFFKYEY